MILNSISNLSLPEFFIFATSFPFTVAVVSDIIDPPVNVITAFISPSSTSNTLFSINSLALDSSFLPSLNISASKR